MVAASIRGRKPMIFILDDDAATCDSLRVLLECEGLTARGFASGSEFLDTVRPAGGDCLLLDRHRPAMRGFDVVQAMRRRGDGVPVSVGTGLPSAPSRARS